MTCGCGNTHLCRSESYARNREETGIKGNTEGWVKIYSVELIAPSDLLGKPSPPQ